MTTLLEQTKALRAGTEVSLGKKILIYARAKAGKTALTGTILKVPEITKVYWFDMEKGIETIQTMKNNKDEYVFTEDELAKVIVFNMPDTEQDPRASITLLEAFSAMQPVNICQKHSRIGCGVCKESIPFCLRMVKEDEAVVIDSGSQLGMSAFNLAKKQATHNNKIKMYGDATVELNNLFSLVQASEATIVMATHVMDIETDKGVLIETVPMCLSRNYSKNVGKFFGHVVYMSMDDAVRKVGSTPTYRAKVLAGSRTGVALSEYGEPSLLAFFHKIEPDKPKLKPGGTLKINLGNT